MISILPGIPSSLGGRSLRQAQHPLYRRAGEGIGGRAVDVGKVVERDQAVERKTTLHEKIDQLRDQRIGPTVALDHAAHAAALLQGAHLECGLDAAPRAADEDSGTAWPQPVDRLAQHGRLGRGFYRDINAAAAEIA